ncbi:uncharacterized protein LOC144218523 [Crocuta crocuta]
MTPTSGLGLPQRFLLSPLCDIIKRFCQDQEVRYRDSEEICGPEKLLKPRLGQWNKDQTNGLFSLWAELALPLICETQDLKSPKELAKELQELTSKRQLFTREEKMRTLKIRAVGTLTQQHRASR